MEEWKARLIEAEKRINGKAVKAPPDSKLLEIKQKSTDLLATGYLELTKRFNEESPLKYKDRFDTFFDDISEEVERIRAIWENPSLQYEREEGGEETWSMEEIERHFIESFEALLDPLYHPLEDIMKGTVHIRLYFLSFYFNALVPDFGFILQGVDGRLSWNLGQIYRDLSHLFRAFMEKGKDKDRITDSRQSLAAKGAELKRAVFYAYKNLRRNQGNKKLTKRDFVKKIEQELSGPGYFAKFKKPPSSRSIVRRLDDLTDEGRIHPPWKKSQT